MISYEIKPDTNNIKGLNRLFDVFRRDYSFQEAYLKGVLLHENGDVQLTYSINEIELSKTYIIAFIFSSQKDYILQVPTNKKPITGIDIFFQDSKQPLFRFIDKTNNVDIVCQKMEITTDVILSKVYAKEQAIRLINTYSDELQKKFEGLKHLKPLNSGKDLFRRDDSYNGIFAKHHTMYKLEDLHNNDNSIVYEFLIEFDRDDPCLGIYYGCKGLIKKGNNCEQQEKIIDEWNSHIKSKVLDRLNKTFPEKRFDNRFKPTDNANDNTFWPFWISLQEDENLLEVAVRATIIIRDEYKRYLEGNNYFPDEISSYSISNIKISNNEIHSKTRYTEEAYNELLNENKAFKKDEGKINIFKSFLENAQKNKYLIRDTKYEKAWKISYLNQAESAFLFRRLFDKMGMNPCWVYLIRIFMSENGEPLEESLRTQADKAGKDSRKKVDKIIDTLLP